MSQTNAKTMKDLRNTVTTRYDFDASLLDDYFPFSGKDIFIHQIAKEMIGYGRWRLTMDLRIDNRESMLAAITADSILIDAWKDDAGELDCDTLLRAAEIILDANEDKLEEVG